MSTLFGEPLFHYEKVQSTNDTALDLMAKAEPNEGTVILADFQTGGKGQFGRTWVSEEGKNLTFSLILRPNVPINSIYYLNMNIALALRDFLMAYLPKDRVTLKWPNDILVGGKKIAGILNQNQIRGDVVQSVVVGVGLNVNQTNFSNIPNGTSLLIETAEQLSTQSLLPLLLERMEKRYQQFRAKRFAQLKEAYEACLHFKNKKTIWQDKSGSEFSGILMGITNTGQAIIKANGVKRQYNHGEIRLSSWNIS